MSMADKHHVEGAVWGKPVNLRGTARANCPLCLARKGSEDRRQSLAVTLDGGIHWFCFRCGARGGASDYDVHKEASERPPVELPEGFYLLAREPGASSEALRAVREYARTRVRADLWERFEVGACAAGKLSGRVIVPVRDENGTLVNWVARLARPAGREDKKYLNAPGGRRVVFNSRVLMEKTNEPALVVEGVFDALALWPHGVALMGMPGANQVVDFVDACRPVVVVLDGDAWHEGHCFAMQLRLAGVQAGWVQLPPRIDPDKVDRAWLRKSAWESLQIA